MSTYTEDEISELSDLSDTAIALAGLCEHLRTVSYGLKDMSREQLVDVSWAFAAAGKLTKMLEDRLFEIGCTTEP